MMSFFNELNPCLQALIAGFGTFGITALGSASIFLFKDINKNIMNVLLSLSAGIMLSSSFFDYVKDFILLDKFEKVFFL